MGLIHLHIISSIPVNLEGIKNFLKTKKQILVSGFSENLSSYKLIKQKSPHILFIDDIGYSPVELDLFIREIYKKNEKIKIILYTNSNDAVYLKNLVKLGIRGMLNHNASRDKIIEAVELVGSGGVYIDNNITFSIFSYDITQGIQKNEVSNLSKREKELLMLIADGIKNKEIAELLFIAQRTVESHKSHLLKKLSLRSTTELTIFAVSNKDEIRRQLNSPVNGNEIEETRK